LAPIASVEKGTDIVNKPKLYPPAVQRAASAHNLSQHPISNPMNNVSRPSCRAAAHPRSCTATDVRADPETSCPRGHTFRLCNFHYTGRVQGTKNELTIVKDADTVIFDTRNSRLRRTGYDGNCNWTVKSDAGHLARDDGQTATRIC